MNESAYENFVHLIAFDREMLKLRTSAHALEQEIATLDKQLQESGKDVDWLHRAASAMRKEVDVKERTMRELDESEKAARVRLEAVANQKEYQALRAEIESLRQEQRAQEESLIEVWAGLDSAQNAYAQGQKKYEQQKAELQTTHDEKMAALASLQNDLDNREKQRVAVEEQVPAEWVAQYSRMRESVPDPVAGVKDGCCDACYYTISKQDLSRLEHRAMLNCKGCYRLLYMQASTPSVTPSEK